VDATVRAAGPGTQRHGWPIGPPRPWDKTWKGHSFRLFRVVDQSRGFFVSVQVRNSADYAMFIHEPGRPSRIVWEREILEPLERASPDIRREIAQIIAGAFNGR
jgi:hypothetical protein